MIGMYIVPTGIEIERFYKEKINIDKLNQKRKELNLNKNDIIVLFVGRIASEKSIDFLIDNHVSLLKKHKNCKKSQTR